MSIHRLVVVTAVTLLGCSLGGCGTINEKLAAGVSDTLPHWAGGLPEDAPPRPGSAKYEAFMQERERRRLEPAPPKDASQSNASALDPLH